MPNEKWIKHAYPLQQITVKLQGTRHSDPQLIISQLETVIQRLKSGEMQGEEHDDDFGYRFCFIPMSPDKSFFDECAGQK